LALALVAVEVVVAVEVAYSWHGILIDEEQHLFVEPRPQLD